MDSQVVKVDKLSCGTCGKHLSSPARLQEHQRTHTGERPHVCNVCNKRFTQRAHLIIHKRTHTGEKPYVCVICNKRFAQSSHLNGHKRVHSGEKPYSCSICKMGFCRKQRLEQHILQHTLSDRSAFIEAQQKVDIVPWSGSVQQLAQVGNIMQRGRPIAVSVSELDGGDQTELTPLTNPRRRKPAFVRKMEIDDMAAIVKTEAEDVDEDRDVADCGKWTEKKIAVIKSPGSDISQPVFPSAQPYGSIFKTDPNADSASPSSEQKVALKATDDTDNLSITSDSNHSSSDIGISSQALRQSLLAQPLRCYGSRSHNSRSSSSTLTSSQVQSLIRTNNRITLVDYSADDLLTHIMSRDDIHRCDFCCVIFQDAAMYHLHRSMHDKMDCRCCNICGKMLKDKYDFTAHFLSEHRA